MEKDLSELTKQVEYYFSDKNLEFDEFFYSEIEANPEGFVPLELLLNCNKVKKMNVTQQDLADAVDMSAMLQTDLHGKCLRRVDRKLPEFKGTRKRKTLTQTPTEPRKASNHSDEKLDDSFFHPFLLVIPDIRNVPKKGKLIEDTIEEQYKIKVPYCRINNRNGHVVFDQNGVESSVIQKLLSDGFMLEGNKIPQVKAEKRDTDFFYKENGSYFEKIVKKKYGKTVKKPQKPDERKLLGAVTFAGRKYDNYSLLQTTFKNMISKTRNGDLVDVKSREQLKELLKYHDKYDEKLKDAEDFLVDFHPVYKQTRCFFTVKEDGTKEDFSLHKCLNNLKAKLMKDM